MKWLYRIVARLCGCRHRWEVLKEIRVTWGGAAIATKYHLRCKRCGWVKAKEV